MVRPASSQSPVNPLPPVIVALGGAIALVEAVLQLGRAGLIGGPQAVGWRVQLMQTLGFSDRVFDHMVAMRTPRLDGIWTFFTYPLVSAAPVPLLISLAILLGVGNRVARSFSWWAILAAFFGSAAVAALFFGVVTSDGPVLAGAFPPAFGLIGLLTWLLWRDAVELGESRWPAFSMIAFLAVFQTAWLVVLGRQTGIFTELVGFAAGFAMAFVLAPDSGARMRRVLESIRER